MAARDLSWLKSAGTSGLISAIAMDAVVGTAIGLTIPLISFGLEAKGASAILIGLNGAAGAVAAMVTAPLTPRLVALLGLRWAALLGLALSAVSVAGFYLLEGLPAWFVLRFLLGISLTTLFVLSEFWIVATAPDDRRGLVMGIYATVLSLGFATGPTILAVTGTVGLAPYLAGIALFFVGAIPILLVSDAAAPQLHGPSSLSLVQVMRAAPAATLAAMVFGAVETGTMTFLPLYGLRIGYEEIGAAALLSAIGLGNVLIQIPLGLLSDKMDRRKLLLMLATLGALGGAAIPLVSHAWLALHLLLVLWGGLIAGLYTVGLAHLGARFIGSELAQANSAFVFCYGIGMLVGPPLMGLGMDLWPPHGAPAMSALMLGLYAVFVMLGMAKRHAS